TVGTVGLRRPARDGFAEEVGDVVLGHAFLEREQLLPRHRQTVERHTDSAQRLAVLRVIGEYSAVKANRILIAAKNGELAGEVELHASIDLTRARMTGISRDKTRQRICIDL